MSHATCPWGHALKWMLEEKKDKVFGIAGYLICLLCKKNANGDKIFHKNACGYKYLLYFCGSKEGESINGKCKM